MKARLLWIDGRRLNDGTLLKSGRQWLCYLDGIVAIHNINSVASYLPQLVDTKQLR